MMKFSLWVIGEFECSNKVSSHIVYHWHKYIQVYIYIYIFMLHTVDTVIWSLKICLNSLTTLKKRSFSVPWKEACRRWSKGKPVI